MNLRLAVPLLVMAIGAFALASSEPNSHRTWNLPSRDSEALWEEALRSYQTGELYTAGDRVRIALDELSWEERYTPEPIIFMVARDSGEVGVDSVWLEHLYHDGIVDRTCHQREPEDCPYSGAATFVKLRDPQLVRYGEAELWSWETGVNPAQCPEESLSLIAHDSRLFRLVRSARGWRLKNEEVRLTGEGWCTHPLIPRDPGPRRRR